MIKNRPLDHIGLAVSDVEADAVWYQEVLGLSVKGKFQNPEGRNVYFLSTADGSVTYEMYQDDSLAAGAKGKIDHISYVSNDIEADYKFCVNAGYDICTDGIEGIPNFWKQGCKYFKIKSPTGEQVEFCQVL
ncbi:VOC family protein [Bariatricus massiliensis]|uniref:VOC family protein n=1 Tax=Bariatricus massiliensis TaxID=1745713 RepID=A0ABS8DGU2_9FIRM|nr:VOC family protein [Bariatricus massiliensis]MCB7304222.1 VOC family protein [Bariatricus massiliensis]MCB7374873.1 VOC family protein [Bariatricus massiliensis]MCB7387332.1 VOC family protein [Bariatricus massiliensis]MCB7411494.1 VOC family protein [Bariatricus massiliensis]MCQ5253629.1 VOC family protein [Bariatricus massiliensis]